MEIRQLFLRIPPDLIPLLTRQLNFNGLFRYLILPFVCLFSSLFSDIIKRDFDESLSRMGLSDHLYFEIYLNSDNKDPLHVRTRDLTTAFRDLYVRNFIQTKDGNKKNKIKIPKMVHQIWLGSPVPDKYKKLMQSWTNLKGWEYKLWTDEDVQQFALHNHELYENARNYGEKSDILRYEILYRHGGLYVDTDFECLNPEFFEYLHHKLDFYAGIEPLEIAIKEQLKVCNALIASKPGHPLMKEFILSLNDSFKLHKNDSTVKLSGPDFITKIIYAFVQAKQPKDIVFFPCTYFYPLLADELHKPLFPESAALHYWAGSWK